jgi:hypothetical protein
MLTAPLALIVPLLLGLPAQAQPAQAQEFEVGTTLICDTQAQVERFVALYDENGQSAVDAVNAEVHDPNACAVSTIAYVRGPQLTTARKKDAAFQIAKVLVLGVVTPTGLQPVPPVTFFSLFEIEELGV